MLNDAISLYDIMLRRRRYANEKCLETVTFVLLPDVIATICECSAMLRHVAEKASCASQIQKETEYLSPADPAAAFEAHGAS